MSSEQIFKTILHTLTRLCFYVKAACCGLDLDHHPAKTTSIAIFKYYISPFASLFLRVNNDNDNDNDNNNNNNNNKDY